MLTVAERMAESADRKDRIEERLRDARLCVNCRHHLWLATTTKKSELPGGGADRVCTLFPFAFDLVTGDESYAPCDELRAISGACGYDGTFFCAKP